MKGIAQQYSYQSTLCVACFLMLSLCAVPLFSQELQWKVLGHLEQPRTEFGIATIGVGKVIVMGGFTNQQGIQRERRRGEITASCEVIDVASRRIVPAPAMNITHACMVTLQTIDSNVIVISGLKTDSITTPICEMFDRRKNTWKILGSLIIGRYLHMAAFINQEEIMVIGGRAEYNYAGTIAEAEIFNIRTGQSRLVSDFPCKLYAASYCQSHLFPGRYPFVVGGRSEGPRSYYQSNSYYYDTLSRHWVRGAVFPLANVRVAHNYLFDHRLVFVSAAKSLLGKQGSQGQCVSVENQNEFSVIGTTLKPFWAATLEPWNNEIILITGGQDEVNRASNHTEWFDLRTRQSFEGPPMNENRALHHSISFPSFDSQGKLQGVCIIAVGGVHSGEKSLSSIEILETTNPQLIEMPSTDIASRRRQQLLTSPAVIITLTAFILVLILALLYLLVQVLIIKQKATLPVWDNEPLEVKQ